MQNEETKEQIETVFKISNSHDELFDSFRAAINQKIKDEDLYYSLLYNKVLSAEEIGMYTEKICKEFPEFTLNIYLAAAEILDSTSSYGKNKEQSFEYIRKAASADKTSCKPYVSISNIYNQELDMPKFENVFAFISKGLDNVKEKSTLYFILAKLFARKGDIETGKFYHRKGKEAQSNGH
jgi:hypothetical protein